MDQYGKPLIVLDLIIDDKCLRDTFRIDTGFDGELAIPEDMVRRYNISCQEHIKLKLLTGEKREFPVIRTKILLGRNIIEARTIVTKVRPGLIGISLLRKITRVMLIDFDDFELKIWLKKQ